jgi:SAM-dependent methyltransferase
MPAPSGDLDPRAYWEARLSRNPDLSGVGYAGLGRQYNGWLYRVRRRVFLRMLRRARRTWSDQTVLDVGSGTGFYVGLWRELGVRSVTGSDITAVAVENLRREMPENEFLRLDIGGEAGELGERRFDAISAMDVLFHITDDQRYCRALANAGRLLRPGGLFVFSDSFLHGPARRAAHEVDRTLSFVEAGVAAAGLEVVSRVPMFVLMNYPLDSTSRVLHSLWHRKARWVERSELAGWLGGAMLYPFELAALRLCREGPSFEIMVCRKPAGE